MTQRPGSSGAREKPAGGRARPVVGARLRAVLRLVVAVVLSLALVWLVSTEDQRRGYLKMLGLWDAAQGLGGRSLHIAAFGSEFEIAHFLPRPAPTTDGIRHAQDGIGHPCRTSGVANPTHKTQQEVYRWTDADGRPAFSDQPPRGADARVVGLTAEGGVGMFSSDYRFVGGAGDSAFASALPANIDGVFRFLEKGLALHEVQPLHVRLTVIDGEQRFVDYLNSKPHKLATAITSGFYSFDGNEAVVRWMGPAVTMAVTRHEITHLALGNWLGDTPLWLNEGLAEFVERLQFQQFYATAPAPVRDLDNVARLRRSGRLPDLRRFLAMDRDDWNRLGNDIAYPYAWSLVHFLLKDPQHRSLVNAYVNSLVQHRCRPFDHAGYLDLNYPGGLDKLAVDWRTWLTEGQAAAVTY